MALYLVRHGEARAEGDDSQRTLTARGREEVGAIARWAARAGVRAAQIQHSGKTRARETAEILAQSLGGPVVAGSGMAPNDDVGEFSQKLADDEMLVGHLPFLSRLTSLLLIDDSERALIDFAPAAMICLVRGEGGWRLIWAMTPALAR